MTTRGSRALVAATFVQAMSAKCDTAASRRQGERMDYDLGVWVLCNQANRAREELAQLE